MKYTVLLLILAVSASIAGFHSVMIPNITRLDLDYFYNNNYDIEAVFGSKVRLYVSDEQETALSNMGYRPVKEIIPVPLVPYPTIPEINTAMSNVVAAHPTIARMEQIGTSVQGREIYAVIVSDNVDQDEAEPEIRITGNIHGDEKGAGMSCLNFLEVLTDNYGTSDMCTYAVDNSEIWIISIVNPDGYTNNQRYNANGIDLNRNLSYMWTGSGGGSAPFCEPETAALRDITMQNWPAIENFINPFATGLSFHGGAECVNCVWNFSETEPIQDLDFITAQANSYAYSPSIIAYYGSFTIYIPGASWYPTNGDVNDWSYGECGTVDHTIEVSDIKSPSDWPGVANANYMAMLDFCITSTYGVYGTVKDNLGNPLDALIQVEKVDGFDSTPLRFCRTDVVDGGYSKALVPGNYNIVATVSGIGSQSQNGVAVAAEEMVPVNFVFGTGIETEEDVQGTFAVFPNPSRESCTISLPAQGVGGTVSIYDITGRSIIMQYVSPETDSFVWNLMDADGFDVPSGIYIARFSTEDSSWTARVIVNR